MPLARLVAEANKQLGITEPQGNVITQLDALLTELVGYTYTADTGYDIDIDIR